MIRSTYSLNHPPQMKQKESIQVSYDFPYLIFYGHVELIGASSVDGSDDACEDEPEKA